MKTLGMLIVALAVIAVSAVLYTHYRNTNSPSGSTSTLMESTLTTTIKTTTTANAATSQSTTTVTANQSFGAMQSCTKNDSRVSDPTAPHGLFVLYPYSTYYSGAIEQYLMNNSLVCGAIFFVPWADVDLGPGHVPRYNFSVIDNEIQPWISAGKEVNLDLWGVNYGDGVKGTTPQYVLNQINVVNCTGLKNQVLPIYWQPGYIDNYRTFVNASVKHYQNNPNIRYIRVGIGVGGEDVPASNIASKQCAQQFEAYGYSGQMWINYTDNMIGYLGSLRSDKQLMVSMNLLPPRSQNATTADAVAAAAAPLGIALGDQGFQVSDIGNNASGIPCSGDFCKNFQRYKGIVPLELQTVAQSCPSGSCQTGSLNQLIPFALSLHTQIFEIYWADWLTALDPSYPNYTSTYANTLESAANVVGYSN